MARLPLSSMLIDLGASGPAGRVPPKASEPLRPCTACRLQEEVSAAAEAAFERGVAEGSTRILAEQAARLHAVEARGREEAARRIATLAEQLLGTLRVELDRLHGDMAATVARLLAAFLKGRVESEALTALATTLRAVLADTAVAEVLISGPAELTDQLHPLLIGLPCSVVTRAVDGADVRIEVDRLVLETAIGGWMREVERAL